MYNHSELKTVYIILLAEDLVWNHRNRNSPSEFSSKQARNLLPSAKPGECGIDIEPANLP